MLTSLTLRDAFNEDPSPHEEDVRDENQTLEAFHAGITARASLLSRLPRLTSLQLLRWDCDDDLAAMLLRYGTASQGRLRSMVLKGPCLTVAACGLVRMACPKLERLQLEVDDNLGGDMLLPFKDVPLTSLIMVGATYVGSDVLRSLGDLTRLQHVDISINRVEPHHFAALAALLDLRHCCAGLSEEAYEALTLLDVSPLFVLTKLTHLQLLGVQSSGSPASPSSDAGLEAVRRALVDLGGLRQLQHLSFSTNFVVTDHVFAALRQLTLLTYLQISRFDVAPSTPGGHLPRLKRLFSSPALRPSQLLQTLMPLLPLPALEFVLGDTMNIDVGSDPADFGDAATQAAALRLSATHLAAVPRPGVTHVRMSCRPVSLQMACQDIADGCHPLASTLEYLTLHRLLVGTECAVLGASLPTLQELRLEECQLTDPALGSLLGRWVGLKVVVVRNCHGVTDEGWVGLVGLRKDPLEVRVEPPLSLPVRLACQMLHERVFGSHNVLFS